MPFMLNKNKLPLPFFLFKKLVESFNIHLKAKNLVKKKQNGVILIYIFIVHSFCTFTHVVSLILIDCPINVALYQTKRNLIDKYDKT